MAGLRDTLPPLSRTQVLLQTRTPRQDFLRMLTLWLLVLRIAHPLECLRASSHSAGYTKRQCPSGQSCQSSCSAICKETKENTVLRLRNIIVIEADVKATRRWNLQHCRGLHRLKGRVLHAWHYWWHYTSFRHYLKLLPNLKEFFLCTFPSVSFCPLLTMVIKGFLKGFACMSVLYMLRVRLSVNHWRLTAEYHKIVILHFKRNKIELRNMMTVCIKDATKIRYDHKLLPTAMSGQLRPVTTTFSNIQIIIRFTEPLRRF